jgi:hypothetical protein
MGFKCILEHSDGHAGRDVRNENGIHDGSQIHLFFPKFDFNFFY